MAIYLCKIPVPVGRAGVTINLNIKGPPEQHTQTSIGLLLRQ